VKQNLTTLEKDIIRDYYEELQLSEFSDSPHDALEITQVLLVHLIKEHGLFKES